MSDRTHEIIDECLFAFGVFLPLLWAVVTLILNLTGVSP